MFKMLISSNMQIKKSEIASKFASNLLTAQRGKPLPLRKFRAKRGQNFEILKPVTASKSASTCSRFHSRSNLVRRFRSALNRRGMVRIDSHFLLSTRRCFHVLQPFLEKRSLVDQSSAWMNTGKRAACGCFTRLHLREQGI